MIVGSSGWVLIPLPIRLHFDAVVRPQSIRVLLKTMPNTGISPPVPLLLVLLLSYLLPASGVSVARYIKKETNWETETVTMGDVASLSSFAKIKDLRAYYQSTVAEDSRCFIAQESRILRDDEYVYATTELALYVLNGKDGYPANEIKGLKGEQAPTIMPINSFI
jgi:hypothetical protein